MSLKTFQEVWYYDDQEKRKKWRTVIWKEFRDMIKRGVWVNVDWSSVLKGRKLIGSKWVFKEKHDGRFLARLVCLGFTQIPKVDFSENYAPVGNDVTFRVVMVLQLMFGFHAVLLDVETAFNMENWKKKYTWKYHRAIKKSIKRQKRYCS